MAEAPVIALLGGGQLGRMFIENALRYDLSIHVLDPDPQAPCAALAHRFVQGDLNDPDTVTAFAAQADVVGIEIEHVSVEALERLKAAGKRVIPDPDVLRTIQDKGLQKQFYEQHGLPTAPYRLLADKHELEQHSALLPAFLKARTGGYDGKGVMALPSADRFAEAFEGPSVLEQCIPIALELAVMVVMDHAGGHVAYDPVEMVFDPELNLVDHLRAPARIPSVTAVQAVDLAVRVARAFGAPGIYAVEMFLTPTGELLVNETAPRAHNSGHHTIEACASSQFDQLLRTYMQWPLGDTELRSPAAMVNLVGEGAAGPPRMEGMHQLLAIPGTFVHLYGKRICKPGRKMGHVTITANDDTALDRAISTTRDHCRISGAVAATSN